MCARHDKLLGRGSQSAFAYHFKKDRFSAASTASKSFFFKTLPLERSANFGKARTTIPKILPKLIL